MSIAQGAANQAHSAIANQFAAADQAAYVAKNQIAQSAAQSAATAQAALAGKQVILSGTILLPYIFLRMNLADINCTLRLFHRS